MESKFRVSDLSYMPVSFRVIGYGDSFLDLIQEIKQIGYEGLQADIIKEPEAIIPGDEDKMLIVLCSTACMGIEGLLNTFHQAGVLTIVISTVPLIIATDTYDSLMIAERNEMINVVKTLLNPVFYQGRINYDFTDLVYTLRDSGRFVTLSAFGCGKNRMKDAVQSLSELFSPNEHVENLSLIIHANDKMIDPPLCVEEAKVLADYISHFPESINVIWAMYNDETLDSHTIGLSAIAGGKNLNIRV